MMTAFIAAGGAVGKIDPSFPPTSREVAVLAVVSHHRAGYAMYAHDRLAVKTTDLTAAQAKEIERGVKPEGLDEPASIAYDVAVALVSTRGPLETRLWEEGLAVFGHVGMQALIQWVAVGRVVWTWC